MSQQRHVLATGTAWVIMFVLLVCSRVVCAADIALQPTQDAPIYGDDGGVSGIDFANRASGAGYSLFVGTNGTGSPRRSLLQFDFSTLPPGATVTAAELHLALDREPNDTPQQLSLHVVNSTWTTGNSNSDTAGSPGQGTTPTAFDATWLYASWPNPGNALGTKWATPGGDFSSTVSASTFVSALGTNGVPKVYVWQSTGMVDDINQWLKRPTSNHGWILTGNERQTQSVKRFISSEALDSNGLPMSADLRPLLLLTYTLDTVTGGGTNASSGTAMPAPWGRLRRRSGSLPPVPLLAH